MSEQRSMRRGPLEPSAEAAVALRPAGPARIDGGLLGARLAVNREVTIPLGWERLAEAGTIDSFRAVAEGGVPAPDGPVYGDSDAYKWLEAAAFELGRGPDRTLAREMESLVRLVRAAQTPEGYLHTASQLHPERGAWFSDLTFGHELYCAGHLFQAAVAVRRAVGATELLDVATRSADHLVEVFGVRGRSGVPGHPEVEMALVELAREVGDRRYLELAREFVERRGRRSLEVERFRHVYFQDHVPLRESTVPEGHAVRALYLACGAADVAVETGDGGLIGALRTQWANMVASKTYLTGGVGSRWEGEAFGDPFELPSDLAYCETCAAVASVMWSWRMLLATGDPRYADLVERTIYNAVLAGVSLDGRRFAYVNPLQVRRGGEQVSPRAASEGRRPWFDCACCPPNLMRTLAAFEYLCLTTSSQGVQLQQFASGSFRARSPIGPIGLRVSTDYPWSGTIEIEIEETPPVEWALSVRQPAWAHGATAAVRGGPAFGVSGGYLVAEHRWRKGEVVDVQLPMSPRWTAGDPRVDAVRGCSALERGPLVYCLEEVDLPPGVDLDTVAWPPRDRRRVEEIATTDLPSVQIGLRVPECGSLLPQAPGAAVRLRAIPYFAWANRGPGAMRVWVADA